MCIIRVSFKANASGTPHTWTAEIAEIMTWNSSTPPLPYNRTPSPTRPFLTPCTLITLIQPYHPIPPFPNATKSIENPVPSFQHNEIECTDNNNRTHETRNLGRDFAEGVTCSLCSTAREPTGGSIKTENTELMKIHKSYYGVYRYR